MEFDTAEAVCAAEIPEGVPAWIKLMPVGNVEAVDGRKWVLDDAGAVVAASQTGIDLVIDFEHQTDLARDNGRPAPAAGWIKELEARPDGIWGRVEWTVAAAEHLRKREYRFISPSFLHARKTGVVKRIVRAALTNSPALTQLPALARNRGDDSMNELLKKLARKLGLPETADEATVLAKATEIEAGSSAPPRSATTSTGSPKPPRKEPSSSKSTCRPPPAWPPSPPWKT